MTTEANSKRVLVVDDEAHVRAVLSRALAMKGYEVGGAADGEEALAALAEDHYDLVILDLKMPGMDGLEVLHRIREGFPDTIALMLTGVADNEMIEAQSMAGGAFAFLTKPCSLEEMIRIIGEAFETGSFPVRAEQSPDAPASQS